MRLEEALKKFAESMKDGIRSYNTVSFRENLVLASGCDNYGCTCIAYEKCCGCLLQ